MKTSLCLFLSVFSITAFAQIKTDISKGGSESILKAAKKSYLSLDARLFQDHTNMQSGRRIITPGERDYNPDTPNCAINRFGLSKNEAKELRKLLEKTAIEDMGFHVTNQAQGFANLTIQGKDVIYCANLTKLSLEHTLNDILVTKSVPVKVWADNIKGPVEIKGLLKDSDALVVTKKGEEEIVPCGDLMFDNAKNGALETGLQALIETEGQIVKILSLGTNKSRIERSNGDIGVIGNWELLAARPVEGFEINEEVYFDSVEGYKKMRVVGANKDKKGYEQQIILQDKNGAITAHRSSITKLNSLIKN